MPKNSKNGGLARNFRILSVTAVSRECVRILKFTRGWPDARAELEGPPAAAGSSLAGPVAPVRERLRNGSQFRLLHFYFYDYRDWQCLGGSERSM